MRRVARAQIHRRGTVLPALLLVIGGLLGGPAAPAHAAAGGLAIVADSSYSVIPEQARVHVAVEAVATSFEPNRPGALVYYASATLAVQPGASNVAASSNGRAIGANITQSNADFTIIDVSFSRRVFYQQSYRFTLSFDLVDTGGPGSRDLRIGHSLVAFPVWAIGSENEPGSSVRVALPPGFTPSVQGGPMTSRQVDDGTLLTASPDDPYSFFAYVSADRPGAFMAREVELRMPGPDAELVIKAWDDDPQWGRRMRNLLGQGLPALRDLIGLPYPALQPVSVEEAATSRLGEYAGIYDALESVIRVRYDADSYVALHEAAHIWFNAALFDERWINEAWAEFYGVAAGTRIGSHGLTYQLTDDLRAVAIPLHDWGAIGVESPEIEDFGYAATYELAGLIADRATMEGLRRVWRAADGRQLAYQPLHASGPPTIGVPPGLQDWQRLLDLLEERSGGDFEDLWSTWVVSDADQGSLDERADARERYAEVVGAAGSWELPEQIRLDLAAWDFPVAERELDAANAVLSQRESIADEASALDLEPPNTLQATFERREGLDAAAGEAADELGALTAIEATEDRLDDPVTPIESIGLLGSDPASDLANARDAFEGGEMDEVTAAARRAVAARDGADALGRERVILGGSGLLALEALVLLGASLRRARRYPYQS
jgi:hypothetical protein